MTEKSPLTVVIDHSAYIQIQKCVEDAANQYEVGGVLLGHRNQGTHYIAAVTTDSSGKTASMTSFALDGDAHSQLAQMIINRHQDSLSFLGVWHSHICDVEQFSQQDRSANRILSSLLGGAISMLVTLQKPSHTLKLHAYYIAQDHSEFHQKIMIQQEEKHGQAESLQ